MRRKVFCAIGAASALVAATLFALVSPAAAQAPGYEVPCTPAVSTDTAGTVGVGGTITITLNPICVWTPGAGVQVAVNGAPVGTKTADGSGFVTVNITAISRTQLSVDDPVIVPARCGANTVTATGPSAVAEANVTHSETFTLVCPGVAAQPIRAAAGAARAKVALTGANVLRWGLIALGLMVVGGVFLAADRRKARSRG